MERVLEVKGRRSQNWERSGTDRLGRQGLDDFRALQADSDDTELAIQFEQLNIKMHVSYAVCAHRLLTCPD